jgi:hypothetical protein
VENEDVAREYELSAYSIVLLGNFNPTIFTPSWFEKYELITEEEAASAVVTVIHPDISRFAAAGLTIQVETNRFAATGTVSAIQLKDFVLKTFRDYLNHTPIRSMGINREVHFKLASADARMRLGRSLAPLEPWGEWGEMIKGSDSKDPGGMLSITMHQSGLSDRPKGHIQATIQPSSSIPRAAGVFFQINDHFESGDTDTNGSEVILDLLDKLFEKSVARSEWIIDQVLKTAEM